MKIAKQLMLFQERIGYKFKDPELLIQATTHSSISSETRPDNQRLEFLGDRVLGLVMAEALLLEDENASEGQLAPRFNALVRKETCAEVAAEIDLGSILRLGRSEMLTGGRRKMTLLGDCIEAVLAAIYLDGGFDAVKTTVLRLWGERISQVEADARDAKTTLQEWAQARGMPPPAYTEQSRSGPDHAPVFVIRVHLQDGRFAQASATSKRNAQHAAAQALLDKLDHQS